MSKTIYYRQCRMYKKHSETCWSEQVSYIPEPYCVVGKVLKLRDEEGNWEDGWIVKTASSYRFPEQSVPDSHRDIKGHRKRTGDSI